MKIRGGRSIIGFMSANEEPITYLLDFMPFDYKLKIGGCLPETIEKRGAKEALRQRFEKHYGSNPNVRVLKATRKFGESDIHDILELYRFRPKPVEEPSHELIDNTTPERVNDRLEFFILPPKLKNMVFNVFDTGMLEPISEEQRHLNKKIVKFKFTNGPYNRSPITSMTSSSQLAYCRDIFDEGNNDLPHHVCKWWLKYDRIKKEEEKRFQEALVSNAY